VVVVGGGGLPALHRGRGLAANHCWCDGRPGATAKHCKCILRPHKLIASFIQARPFTC
jgi:hypothetical protein